MDQSGKKARQEDSESAEANAEREKDGRVEAVGGD